MSMVLRIEHLREKPTTALTGMTRLSLSTPVDTGLHSCCGKLPAISAKIKLMKGRRTG